MHRLVKIVRQWVRGEDGVSATEYAVMLSLIIVVCLFAIQQLGFFSNQAFGMVGGSVGDAVGSGT